MLRPRPGRRSAVFSGISAAALTTLTVVGLAALPTAQASAYASPGAPSRALSPATTATHQINAGAVARNSDGRLEIFAIGSDSAVWQDTQSAANASTWNGWTSLGGGVNATPVAGQESDGRLAVFDTNSAGTVFQDVQTTAGASTWSGWAGLGGDMVASSLSVVKTSDGKLNLFAINASNLSVQVNTQTTAGGGWGGWTSLGIPGTGVQPQFAELTAIQNTDGRLEAFAISGLTTYVDEQLTAGGSWGGWSAFSTGNETHSVSVAKNLDGRLEILAWDKVSSLSTPITTSWLRPPCPSCKDRIFAARGGSSLWHIVHQSPMKSTTMGRPSPPPLSGVPTVFATLTPGSENVGALPPACGGPPLLDVPMLVNSPIPSPTTAMAATNRRIAVRRWRWGTDPRAGRRSSLNAW